MSGIRLFDKLHVRPTVTIVLLFFDSFADDHTRVQLVELDGYPGSDYINANFIDVSTTTKITTVTICLNLYSFTMIGIQFFLSRSLPNQNSRP